MSWKKLSSRIVYDNPWITVREDQVVNPGGGQNLYGQVHFKNVAVAIVPIDEDRHTWIVGQDRYTLDRYSWELPMGGSPENEDPEQSARRELAEETGLSAQHFRKLMVVHTSNSITDERGIVYVATGLTMGRASPEETENITARRIPLDEAVAMVERGEITDAISCAALLQVARLGASTFL